MSGQWNHKILTVGAGDFEALALEIFRFQYQNNPVYGAYIRALQIDPASVVSITRIPFLPIRFFKSHDIVTGSFEAPVIFESSGTTSTKASRHFVKDPGLYEDSFLNTFQSFYGSVNEYSIIGLLPSYLERGHSSLVYMVSKLIEQSRHPRSGFYLYDHSRLYDVLKQSEREGQKTLLIGVTYALLDFAEKFPFPLHNSMVMETGGMKGRREEIVRPALHRILKEAFGIASVHSEYGMTELLSQAYSQRDGIFRCPPWMKVLTRDDEDPFFIKKTGGGVLSIIDLANIWSCSFIATDDVGHVYADGSFEVLGRIDGSDLRGCSLLTAL